MLNKYVKSILLVLVAILMFLPIAWLVISSFRSNSELVNAPFNLPRTLTFSNYESLRNIPNFYQSIGNSFIIAMIATCIVLALAIPLSYLVSRYNFTGKNIIEKSSLYLGYLFAPSVLAFPYFIFFSKVGLINSPIAVIIAHIAFALPFSFYINRLIFDSLPARIEEVAQIDNAPFFTIVTKIVLPAIRPQISMLAILVFAISWKEFFFAFLFSYDGRSMTLPVLLSILYNGESINWNLVVSIATVLMLPSFIMLILLLSISRTTSVLSGSKG